MSRAAPNLDTALTEQEIDSYRRDGFLVPRFRFAGDELRDLRALSDRLVNDNISLIGNPLPGAHLRRPASTGMICAFSISSSRSPVPTSSSGTPRCFTNPLEWDRPRRFTRMPPIGR
jgi:hypothetical protein